MEFILHRLGLPGSLDGFADLSWGQMAMAVCGALVACVGMCVTVYKTGRLGAAGLKKGKALAGRGVARYRRARAVSPLAQSLLDAMDTQTCQLIVPPGRLGPPVNEMPWSNSPYLQVGRDLFVTFDQLPVQVTTDKPPHYRLGLAWSSMNLSGPKLTKRERRLLAQRAYAIRNLLLAKQHELDGQFLASQVSGGLNYDGRAVRGESEWRVRVCYRAWPEEQVFTQTEERCPAEMRHPSANGIPASEVRALRSQRQGGERPEA